MTDLERARVDVEVLRRLGIKDNVTHFHVGTSSVRCEFCFAPLWAEVHDPMNVNAGKIINKAVGFERQEVVDGKVVNKAEQWKPGPSETK